MFQLSFYTLFRWWCRSFFIHFTQTNGGNDPVWPAHIFETGGSSTVCLVGGFGKPPPHHLLGNLKIFIPKCEKSNFIINSNKQVSFLEFFMILHGTTFVESTWNLLPQKSNSEIGLVQGVLLVRRAHLILATWLGQFKGKRGKLRRSVYPLICIMVRYYMILCDMVLYTSFIVLSFLEHAILCYLMI